MNSLRRPRAAIFDCDGLLVDTEPSWTVAETELFARRGLPFGTEQKALLIGRTLAAACAAVADLLGEPGTGPQLEVELRALVEQAVEQHAAPMPGAVEIVEAAARRVPIAVASNSPRSLLQTALRRGGLADRFAVSLSADDVEKAKPDPQMYLTAAAMLGVEPGSCVAFEDSATGARSARAAGIVCVGVPTLPGTDLGTEVTVAALTDLDLCAWVRSW